MQLATMIREECANWRNWGCLCASFDKAGAIARCKPTPSCGPTHGKKCVYFEGYVAPMSQMPHISQDRQEEFREAVREYHSRTLDRQVIAV